MSKEGEELLAKLKQFNGGPACYVVCSACGHKTEVKGSLVVKRGPEGGLLCGPCWLREGTPLFANVGLE